MMFTYITATAALVEMALAVSSQMPDQQRDNTTSAATLECGPGVGSCPAGKCCSSAGYCGTSVDYCKGPQCQIEYSGGNCDANKRPGGESTFHSAASPRPRDDIPYGKFITQCTMPDSIALTFDDDPSVYTQELIDVLDKFHVKATFWIVGNSMGRGAIDDDAYPWKKILQSAHQSGHQLGSHTWTHQDLTAASEEIREEQLVYNEMAFRNIFGFFPRYMRPPYGTCTIDSGCLQQVTDLGYHIVTWNIDTKDYMYDSPDLIQEAKNRFRDGLEEHESGSIVLAHGLFEQTVANLTQYMIEEAEARGLNFMTVAECLGETDRRNWYIDASKTKRGKSKGSARRCHSNRG